MFARVGHWGLTAFLLSALPHQRGERWAVNYGRGECFASRGCHESSIRRSSGKDAVNFEDNESNSADFA